MAEKSMWESLKGSLTSGMADAKELDHTDRAKKNAENPDLNSNPNPYKEVQKKQGLGYKSAPAPR